jgi:FAD/FMN-containing dehydrogenase/Fe-S oxidoreductase
MLISTDASIFEIEPKEVVYPNSRDDLVKTIRQLLFKNQHFTMRAGGTSIGGQAIGSGVLVDISKHLTKIINFSEEDREVIVEPGVIQDDLNNFLKPYNLKFAPDTSTSNRAMVGGMIGNNSCGAYSVFYGTTREHVKSVEVVLSDGSLVEFKELNEVELDKKLTLKTLEGDIYRFIINLLNKNKQQILDAFPDESLIRRNTGYALDELIRKYLLDYSKGKKFSIVPLICGSEGTLGVIVSAKLNLVDLPKYKGLIVAHFSSDKDSLSLVESLLDFQPSAIEYIDKPTLDASKSNALQKKNRVWINKDPQSVLILEFFSNTKKELNEKLASCKQWLLSSNAYHVGIVNNQDYPKVWEVRKAGLGLLMGKVGAKKAVAIIEDVAVPLKYLYSYYQEIKALMQFYDVEAVYYGHASVGLIHVRPMLDLSSDIDRKKAKDISQEVSAIVKKYKGSLSGEHGDGRVRAPYLQQQFGQTVYQYLINLKNTFDPNNLFNPGSIILDKDQVNHLREVGIPVNKITTKFNWSKDISFSYAAEKCNGAGACRKSTGGVMCPSYRATREEKFSTRGRANLLRKALYSSDPIKELKNQELKEALNLCLSCKACKSECPASVDMSKLKSEYLYQIRTKSQLQGWHIKHFGSILKVASRFPKLFSHIQNLSIVRGITGIRKALPDLANISLDNWWYENKKNNKSVHSISICVICDPYTQYYDVESGKSFLTFLQACNVNINVIFSKYSIRAMISNGLLDDAEHAIIKTIDQLNSAFKSDFITGIEVSEVLAWRDDAKDLFDGNLRKILLFEELLLELNKFGSLPRMKEINSKVWIYTHCHQKALTDSLTLKQALSLIRGINMEIIDSGCCGMAGDFGYKHPELSTKIAQQSLKKAISKIKNDDILIATGTSCRNQLSDVFQNNSIHLSQLFLKTINNKIIK